MLTIEILDEQDHPLTAQQRKLLQTCLQVAAEAEAVSGEVVVTLVDNQRIQELNLQYRGIDRPTDVLSFAMNETVEGELAIQMDDETASELPNMLGDIVISVPQAMAQAEEYGHSLERELGFLAVHGFLHLLGYDHQSEAEEAEMFTRQEQILQRVGLTR